MLSFAPRQADRVPQRPATRIPTVCVVDRQANDHQAWRDAAEVGDVRLQVVASAEEALRLARSQAIDLWVVNTELPGLSGCELCGMLKARSASTAVYLVADEYSPDLERAAWAARATLFAVKPMQLAGVQQWLAHHRSSPCATRDSIRS